MRTKKELYQLILKSFMTYEDFTGICLVIDRLYLRKVISSEEHKFIFADFTKHYPRWYNSKFYYSKYFSRQGVVSFWWPPTLIGRDQRIKFLNYLINKSN